MPVSTLTSKGQITIPKEIRDKLGLKVGDRLLFTLDRKGSVVLRAQRHSPLGTMPGLLGHLAGKRAVSIEEMRKAVRARARRKYPLHRQR